jgi:murein DD-endopeptidase MepM/ murein hydrolase activator NlpD
MAGKHRKLNKVEEKYFNAKSNLNKDLPLLKTVAKNFTQITLHKTSKIYKNPALYFSASALAFNLILATSVFNFSNTLTQNMDILNYESKTGIMKPDEVFQAKIIETEIYATETLMLDIIDKDYDLLGELKLNEINIEEYTRESDAFENDLTSKIQWPFPKGVPISSGYGYRTPSCKYCSSDHKGLDFTPGLGAGVQAVADGVVIETINYPLTYMDTPEASYGTYVKIRHNVDGIEFESLYAHLMFGSVAVLAGDEVKVGDFIGQVGETGIVTGPHLHFEIRIDGKQVNPYTWLKEMNAKTSASAE